MYEAQQCVVSLHADVVFHPEADEIAVKPRNFGFSSFSYVKEHGREVVGCVTGDTAARITKVLYRQLLRKF